MHQHPLPRRTFLAAMAAAGLGTPLLGACSGGTGAPPESSGGKVTVEWWHIQTQEPSKTLWDKAAKAYMKANPNVTIKPVILENEAFKSKMTAVTASGKLPDIFHTWGGGVLKQRIDAGLVKDLTPGMSSWVDQFFPISLKAYQWDGKTYAVPFDMGMVGFWYNKALFKKAGISEPPATWGELIEDIKKLKANGITPIAIAGKDKWPEMYWWAYLSMRIGGLGALAQAGSSHDFTAQPFVDAGQRLADLAALEPFQKGYQNASYDQPGGEAATMGNGKAGMELMGQWAPMVQNSSGKGLGKDLGFFPFPALEGGQGVITEVFGGGGGYALRKDAPDAALDFLKFFTSVDQFTKLVSGGAVRPVVKATESALDDPNEEMVVDALAKATGFQLYLDQAYPPAVGQEINDSVAALVAGKKTPQQVTQSITQVAKSQ